MFPKLIMVTNAAIKTIVYMKKMWKKSLKQNIS
jgi:hypothetical protein